MLLMVLIAPWAMAQQALPYSYGFEDNDLSVDGWTVYFGTSLTANNDECGISTDAAKTGDYGFQFSSYSTSGANAQYLISPELSASKGAILQFYYSVYNSWGSEKFKVGYSTTDTNISSFTFGSEVSTNSESWVLSDEFVFPAGTKYVAIYYYANYQYYLYIDDLSFTAPPSCVKPTGLAATLTPGNGTIATLNWTAGGEETAWVLEYGTASDFTGATSVNVSGTPTKNLTGLTAETKYYARVKADCGGDYSDWSATCEFTPTNEMAVTVCDGTATSSNAPIRSGSGTQSEFVYPASMLTALNGKSITSVTFYASTTSASASYTNKVTVYMEEVAETTESTSAWLYNQSTATKVYEGTTLTVTDGIMVITFDEPYEYQGGNLCFNTWANTSAPSVTWKGENPGYASCGYDWSITPPVSSPYNTAQFLPKAKFIFESNAYPKPKNLTVTNITNNSATITWEAPNSDVQSYKYQYREEGGTWNALTSTTALSAPLTGLTGNTTYEFQVQAIYAGNNESAFASTSFTTLCDAFPIPYAFGFEDAEIVDLNCWTIIDAYGRTTIGDENTFTSNPVPAHSGEKWFGFTYYDYPDTDPQYMTLISPEMTGMVNGLHVEFYYRTDGQSTYPETFRVGYSTTDNNLSSFTWVNTITDAVAADYQLFKANYPASTKYVAVQHLSDDMDYLILDDFSFTEAPSCLAPSSLLVSSITTTGATLSWTAGGAESAWDIYVTDDNTIVPNDETTPTYAGVTSNTNYPISGLTSGTTYYVYLRSACDATTHSDWTMPTSFNTECEAISLPYSYDFEDDELPLCWNTIGTNTGWITSSISNTAPQHGSKHFVIQTSNYATGTQYVVLPEVDASYPLNEYEITFYSKLAGSSTSGRTLSVGVMTDPDDATTFVQIGDVFTPTTDYVQYKVRLNTYTGNGQYIAIKHNITSASYYNDYTYIDNLEVNPIPACIEPDGLTCTGYTATTATFDWTGAGDNQTAWQLYISDKNIAPADNIDESEVINVTTKPYTVPGLTAEKTYYAWVRGNCTASSEGYSEWVGGVEFMPSAYKDFTYNQTATSNTSYVPFYSYYTTSVTKGQMLVLASSFPENMFDATVRRLTFYTISGYATADWGDAEFDVLVTEVDATSFETAAFFNWDDMTTVFSGKLSVNNSEMVINFDTPYTYNGGNLLIGINLTTTGTSKTVYWVASYGSTYLGAYQYSTNSVSRTSYQPKMTFNYLPTETPRPTNVHPTEELSTEATLAWVAPYTGTATGYEYQYKLATETAWSPAETTTELHATIAGLTPEKTYDFRVRAIYAGPAYSDYATTQCTTTAACAIPDGLAAANLTMNTADLTWNASSEVANYTVEYRTVAYYDLFQGFENGFEGWTVINESTSSGSPNNVPDINAAAKRTDNYGFRFSSWSTSSTGYDQYLISPMISFTGKVKFYYREQTTSYGDEKFKVGYSSTDNSISSFTWGDVVVVSNDAYADDKYYEEAIPDGTKYVAIYYCTGACVSRLFIDDITLGNINPAGTWQTATTAAPNTGAYTIEGLTAGIKYDIRVYANCTTDPDGESTTTTITTLADGTKVFTNAGGDGKWNTAANWSPSGAPSITEDAVIRSNVSIFGDATAKKITFEGTTTPVLTIENGGTLQTDNTVTATVKKHIIGYSTGNDKYYLVATPLNASGSPSTYGMITDNLGSSATTATATYDLYNWDYTAADEWKNYRHSTFYLYNGTGYLYANKSDVDLTFTGTVMANNADVTKNLNYSSTGTYAFNGWNLVGNPFACDAYTKDATDNVAAFYRMNAAGNGFEVATGAIKPMEGIFVKATATGQSFKFTRTAPVTSNGNGNLNIQLAKKVTSRDEVATTDNAIVRFDGGNTLEKFMFRQDNMKIYIPQDGADFAVVASEAKGVLPVNVKVATTGNYTINFSNDDIEFAYLHLIDRFTGEDIDLLIDPEYTFIASPRDKENRFNLVFNSFDSNIDIESDIFAYQSGDEIIVSGEGELQIFDVMGRFVTSMKVNGSERISASTYANGVYVFRMVGETVKTQKIVVK